MLPRTLFERLSTAYRLKGSVGNRERRGAIRVAMRAQARIVPFRGAAVGCAVPARMRELSMGGCSLLSRGRLQAGQEFLLRIEGPDQATYWIWCRCRRCVEVDRLSFTIGCGFVRVLYPGQELRPGSNATQALWLDVDGDAEPDDPYAIAA